MSKQRGRPTKIGSEHEAVLAQIVASEPTATLKETCAELERRTGVKVSGPTLVSALRRQGIERVPGREAVVVETADPAPARYGYGQAHRRVESEQVYPSCLTDAEWALVRDLFENEGGRGLPPRVSRRTVVDACCYVVRTGCSWRMLPKHFPRWQNVYRTFRRWSEQGRFETMHDRLRGQWREREARNVDPTGAVIDAQSTRGSPQGGDTGFDAGKKGQGTQAAPCRGHVRIATGGVRDGCQCAGSGRRSSGRGPGDGQISHDPDTVCG